MMKKLCPLVFLKFLVIFLASCAEEGEYIANLPKVEGFVEKNIYRLNGNLLVKYRDLSGNSVILKLNESSAKWKIILFKTKESYRH